MGKIKFHHFPPLLEKVWKKPLVAPWKNPSDAHEYGLLSWDVRTAYVWV